MFPKKERVHKADFDTILKRARTVTSEHLTLRYVENNLSINKKNKYSFVVSANVSKLATIRNLLKRRGRHIIRTITKKIKTPYACVFFFKPRSADIDFASLEKEILMLLDKANIIV